MGLGGVRREDHRLVVPGTTPSGGNHRAVVRSAPASSKIHRAVVRSMTSVRRESPCRGSFDNLRPALSTTPRYFMLYDLASAHRRNGRAVVSFICCASATMFGRVASQGPFSPSTPTHVGAAEASRSAGQSKIGNAV